MATENLTAIRAIQLPPLYNEACAEADRYGVTDPAQLEQIRLSMCHREFMQRTQWMRDALVKYHPSMLRMEPTPEYIEFERNVRAMIDREAAALGLSYAV